MENFIFYGLSGSALTIGITEVIKRLGTPQRFIPLVSIIVGTAIVCLGTLSLSVSAILTGIAIGLSAAGIWDLSKKTILNK